MKNTKVPHNANLFVELGSPRPIEAAYKPIVPYKLGWIITNGEFKKHFLWIVVRNTGIYVATGMPNGFHTSYHSDGRFQWRSKQLNIDEKFEDRPPLNELDKPIIIQNATSSIADETLKSFELSDFNESEPINEIIYMDNRTLPKSIHFTVWAVPPFLHHQVPLHTDSPVHFHMVSHTDPWIVVTIYDQK